MTSDQEKKPGQTKKLWRFSLAQAMTAITVICITLAASVAVWKGGYEVAVVPVIMSGIGAMIGALLDGLMGAINGTVIGFFLFLALCLLMALF